MYDPSIGRWISEDPLGFQIPEAPNEGRYTWASRERGAEGKLERDRAPHYFNPHSGGWVSVDSTYNRGESNLYRYVNNRPTEATDPSGLMVKLLLDEARTAKIPLGGYHVTVLWYDKDRSVAFDGGGSGDVNKETGRPTVHRNPAKAGDTNTGVPKGGWHSVESPYKTAKEELGALDTAFFKLKQLPYYVLGSNSNTYARQLLKLAGFKVRDVYQDSTIWLVHDGTLPLPNPKQPNQAGWVYLDKREATYGRFYLSMTTSHLVGPTSVPGWNNSSYGGAEYDEWGNAKK